MRCQYCGKRLPLFRKLKDGEFCSAAHRAQFLAQSDQLALTALTEQRERTLRARQKTTDEAAPLPRSSPSRGTAAPSNDTSFCDRYLVSSLAALPLGQLAGVALDPAPVALELFMPERGRTASWSASANLARLSADQTLRALNDHGASVTRQSSAAVSVPVMPAKRGEPTMAEVPRPSLILWATPQAEPGERVLDLPAVWRTTQTAAAALSLNLAPDPANYCERLEASAMAEAVPVSRQIAYAPSAVLLSTPVVAQFAYDCFVWLSRRPRAASTVELATAGMTPLLAAAVAPPALMTVAGSVARFPAMVPNFSTMPVRQKSILAWAPPAPSTFSLNARLAVERVPGLAAPDRAINVLTPEMMLGRAQAAISSRLKIAGQLSDLLVSDLLEPTSLAPARRMNWRWETRALTGVSTLAVRHLAMDVAMVLPARPAMAAGPRRADQQVRLNSAVRPARIEYAAGADSVTFHLEPKVMQPRLRTQPDPARQSLTAGRKGKNQADAAISSIKIPVLRRFWEHAPADIRWVALIIPLVFFLAWYSWTPDGKALNRQAEKADLAVDTSGVQTMLASFKSRISSRAAVELGEDFRAGLGEWKGAREDWAENWSYDQAGFVRPGNLAIFTPTAGLKDYTFEFLGQIESRALSWVYRAKDTRNYYSGKLVIVRGGPVPEVAFIRSVVKDGRESHRKQISMVMNLRSDTLYRIRVDVNGSDFTTSVLGQVVDTFTDETHSQGGIGFSGGRGEVGRIRWVEVSHQYDTLGRLCAMLVPYGVGGATAPAKSMGQ